MELDILEEMMLLQAQQANPQPGVPVSVHVPSYSCPQQNPDLKSVVPSPRGIQDGFFDFIGEDPTSAPVAAPCAPVAAPSVSTYPQPWFAHAQTEAARFKPHQPALSSVSLQHSTVSAEPSHVAPPSLTIAPPQFTAESITPWIEDSSSTTHRIDGSTASASTTRPGDDDDFDGSKELLHVEKKPKAFASSRVMPPTAKSILERRERALREGRRSEARLNDEERRILRRLRNRESAERCARRKNEQAQIMSIKIENLENENHQLRSLAMEYEAEISKLEKVLWQRKANHRTS